MVRRALALPVVLVLVFAGLWLAPLRAPAPLDAAQAGTGSPLASPAGSPAAAPDLGFNLPAGITLTPLAAGIANDLPGTPAHLALTRPAVAPHANLGQRQTAGPELVYVESGAIVTVDELGLENTYPQGSQLLLQSGATYTLRNDAAQPASLLRLSLAPPTPAATAPASPAANGTPAAASPETALLAADVANLPSAPARVFLARVTWAPGAALPDHTFTGPVGLLTESGTLTVSRPSGTAGQLQPGKGIVIPPDVVTGERNAGTTPAVTLMFGVVTTTQQAVVPVPTPPPPPQAGTVLYQADVANGGFDQWPGSSDWKHVDGMLVNDGTSIAYANWIAAPDQPAIADYTVEAQIQWLGGSYCCDASFGIVSRASDDGAYRAGYFGSNGSQGSVFIIGNSTDVHAPYLTPLAFLAFAPGTDWHTYRLEVRGNAIRLFIDDQLVLETADNTHLAAGRVGIWSYRAQVNVRSFKVIAL